jgi:hypothetical protein
LTQLTAYAQYSCRFTTLSRMAQPRVTSPEPGSALDVVRTWDARAERYLQLFRNELDGKPFDRAILADFVLLAARPTDPLRSELQVYWAEFTAQELHDAAAASGFHIDEITTRAAYDDEIPTPRIYLSATRR